MTVLVTGATGNVGTYLVQHLLDLGANVRCLTRDPSRASFPDSVEVLKGDLADPATLEAAFDGVEAVHLITFAGNDYTPIPNGKAIVQELTDAGVKRVTVLKGDTEESPIEIAVRESPLEWAALAPVEFMANMLGWVDGVRTGKIEEGFVDMPSTVVHESDIAAVAAHVLVKGGHHRQTLWITGPQALTVRERVDIIQDVTGQRVELEPLSTAAIQEQWRSYGLTDDDVEYMTLMKTNPPEAAKVPQDTTRTVTGQEPLTFRDWVLEHRAAFSNEQGG